MATSILLVVHHWSHDYIHPQIQKENQINHIAWFTNVKWLHPFSWWFITGRMITSTHKFFKQVLGTDQPQVQWLAHARPLQSKHRDYSSYK
jgi:hypothetical protein